jgi:hypothetical protein
MTIGGSAATHAATIAARRCVDLLLCLALRALPENRGVSQRGSASMSILQSCCLF